MACGHGLGFSCVLEEIVESTGEVEIYRNRMLTRLTLGELAREALQKISGKTENV